MFFLGSINISLNSMDDISRFATRYQAMDAIDYNVVDNGFIQQPTSFLGMMKKIQEKNQSANINSQFQVIKTPLQKENIKNKKNFQEQVQEESIDIQLQVIQNKQKERDAKIVPYLQAIETQLQEKLSKNIEDDQEDYLVEEIHTNLFFLHVTKEAEKNRKAVTLLSPNSVEYAINSPKGILKKSK